MRPELSIITLFRSPIKTLVTFLLLFATSFAFVARGAEYAATVRETKRAEAEYSAVGTIQRTTNAYYDYMESKLGEYAEAYEGGTYLDRLDRAVAPLEDGAASLVLSNEHVLSGGAFRVAGGTTSAELTNVVEQPLFEVPGYSEWKWDAAEGTFQMDTGAVIAENITSDEADLPAYLGNYILETVLGDGDIYPAHRKLGNMYDDSYGSYLYIANSENMMMLWEPDFEETSHRRFFYLLQRDPFYTTAESTNIVPYVDYPYINLSKLEEEYGVSDWRTALENPEKYGLIKYKNYYDLPLVPTLEYMDTVDRNFRTQELVYVPDMEEIHRFHAGHLYITDGRAVTAEDTGYVCVVSREYAEKNGLKVGDRIEFEVSADTMAHSGRVFGREPPYPYVNYTRIDRPYKRIYTAEISPLACEQSLSDLGFEPVTREYEIVGIWSDSGYDIENPYCYSLNTVFVPEATYPWPEEVEPRLMPSNFSFTLEHPGDMALIEDELGPELAAMGYELVINDEGYAAAKPSFDFMRLSSLIGFVGMALALLVSFLLITYLFIIRKKHDYAIMRALGTPVPRANASLLVGLSALALMAVLLGTALAVAATSGFASELSAQIGEVTGGDASAALPLWTFGAFGAGTLALLLAFARIGLSKVGRIPPLVLLQGK